MLITENADLTRLTTMGVPARARWLVELHAADDLVASMDIAPELPRFVLGGGSNLLLLGDQQRVFLKVALQGRAVLPSPDDDGSVLVQAAAGEPWHEFVLWTLAQGLVGLENLALIPGTVGAAPVQNIGAYGLEVGERIAWVDAVRVVANADARADETSAEPMQSLAHAASASLQTRRFSAAECGFGYRDSMFKHPDGAEWLITQVVFKLAPQALVSDGVQPFRDAFGPRLGYGDVRAHLQQMHPTLTLADLDAGRVTGQHVADAVIAIRRSKLPDPAVIGNAGSFFKNPVVATPVADALKARFNTMPTYPTTDPSQTKLSAGWLIDQCGFKGWRQGDAGVHDRHALVLVNHGQAQGQQLFALAQLIQQRVADRFGVALEPEPLIL